MIVSYSEVAKWDTCKRQYYYAFDLGYQPAQLSLAVNTGIDGHRLLQVFYEVTRDGMSKDEALAHIENLVHEETVKNGFSNSLTKAWILVTNYIRSREFKHEAILVENRFLIPANKLFAPDREVNWDEVEIGFTPDVVFERPGGWIDVEDAKFIGRAWPDKKLQRFPQAKLYQAFLKRMGYKVGKSSIRFFNTATAVINEAPFIMKPAEEEILLRDFSKSVKDIILHKQEDDLTKSFSPRTMNYSACQYCSYAFPCNLDATGKDSTKTLEQEFVKSNYNYNR